MAVLHDWGCPREGCDVIAFDLTAPIVCPVHNEQMEIRYLPRGSRPFPKFDFDGTEVTSITQLRSIEERSVKAFERGEGQPYLFRLFNQDHSNRDVNLFQKLHPQVPRDKLVTRTSRGIPFVGTTHSRDGLSEE